jgi:hypothetical protein
VDGPGSCAGDYTPAGAPPRPGARIVTLGVPPTRASRHYRGFPVYWRAITAFQRDADPYRMDQVLFWFALPPMLKNAPLLSPVPRERGPPAPGSDRRQPGNPELVVDEPPATALQHRGLLIRHARYSIPRRVPRSSTWPASAASILGGWSCKGAPTGARPRWTRDGGHGASVRGRRRAYYPGCARAIRASFRAG